MRGGYGSSQHGSLADRHRTAQPAATVPSGPESPARHCRVDGEPGLLVEWRRGEQGWEGRVVSVTWLDAVGWATIDRWLPAADLEAVP